MHKEVSYSLCELKWAGTLQTSASQKFNVQPCISAAALVLSLINTTDEGTSSCCQAHLALDTSTNCAEWQRRKCWTVRATHLSHFKTA